MTGDETSGLSFEDGETLSAMTGGQRTRKFRERAAAQGIARTDRFMLDGSRVPRHKERKFIAWDGEGSGRDYTLFSWSDGEQFGSITDERGLGTRRILEFIQSVADENPTAIHVIYGGSYDFNHWMRDLDRAELLTIHTARRSGRNSFPTIELDRGFPVQFNVLMNKWFYFKLPGKKKGVKVFDVLPFFQCSFVKACDDYITGKFGEETWLERDMIKHMKAHRDELGDMDPADVDRYNRAELVNLVRLADTLRDNAASVNLIPDSWHGPAAIASKLFRDYKVRQHMSPYVSDADTSSEIPPEVRRAARFAYAGGRAEMLKFGDIAGPVYEYDLCSAYPAAMQHLPSLVGGTWTHHTGNPQLSSRGGKQHFAIYRVRWQMFPEFAEQPCPFPFRQSNAAMVFPFDGENWVWWPEFDAAWRANTARIEVLEAWTYEPPRSQSPSRTTNDPVRPFAFVPEKYEERMRLKRAGDGGQFAIKLGLNSMYGKLAQQTGARRVRSRETGLESWAVPRYHQLEWAGWVTSWCRARVYEASQQAPYATIAFATDAVFSEVPLSLDFGNGLGQWEETIWDEFCNIQSGLYFGTVDGKPKNKSRGVDRRDDIAELVRAHWDDPDGVPMQKRGFITLGLALASDARFKTWRDWLDMPKRVKIGGGTKRIYGGTDARGMTCSTARIVSQPVSDEFSIEWINPNPLHDRGRIAREVNNSTVMNTDAFTEMELDSLVIEED